MTLCSFLTMRKSEDTERDSRMSRSVVPPLLTEFRSRGHAAMGNFCFGGTPPMAVFGRS